MFVISTYIYISIYLFIYLSTDDPHHVHSLPLATPRAALETEPPALHSAVPPGQKTFIIVDIGYLHIL